MAGFYPKDWILVDCTNLYCYSHTSYYLPITAKYKQIPTQISLSNLTK